MVTAGDNNLLLSHNPHSLFCHWQLCQLTQCCVKQIRCGLSVNEESNVHSSVVVKTWCQGLDTETLALVAVFAQNSWNLMQTSLKRIIQTVQTVVHVRSHTAH